MHKITSFTIETIDEAGLGDQLGTQFARLYLIGQMLKLKYLHKPFHIPRSTNSTFQNLLNSLYLGVGKKLILVGEKIAAFQYLYKGWYFIYKALSKLSAKLSDPYKINAFIGTNYRDEIKTKGVTVDLYALINMSSSQLELENLLIKKLEDFPDQSHLILRWTPELYGLSYKIDELFNKGKTINECDYLKNQFTYSNQKSPSTFVIHIRCGDSVTINHQNGDLEIFADKVNFINENGQTQIAGDNNRRAIGVDVFKKILSDYQLPSHVQTVLISDGYALSKIVLMNFLLKNNGHLNSQQSKILRESIARDLDKEIILSGFKDVVDEFIIGETELNFKKSLQYLAIADVLLFGHGGFSYYLHSIYRKNPLSYIAHAFETKEVLKTNFDRVLGVN